jgi:hypothetical protein
MIFSIEEKEATKGKAHVKLKLCTASYHISFDGSISLHFHSLTNFLLSISLPFFASCSRQFSIQYEFVCHLIKFRHLSQKFYHLISAFSHLHTSRDLHKKRVCDWKKMEMLHIDGQSIKFVDRKLWKRDSLDGKLNFEGRIYTPPSSAGANSKCEIKAGKRVIRKKCPIEIEYPRKRRILKRPKRFKNYYSDRKPLSIPRFSFPRCLMAN